MIYIFLEGEAGEAAPADPGWYATVYLAFQLF